MSDARGRAAGARSLSARLGFPETTLEVGPLHPAVQRVVTATGGTTSFLVDLDDDRIQALEVSIGLGHRGFEFEVESRDWVAALPYVSRLGWAGSVHAETAYCLTVESLAGVALPDRAIWHRMLLCELARVADHFVRLGATMGAIGSRDAENVAAAAEERALGALRLAAGAGPLDGALCVGGMRTPLSSDFLGSWPAWRKHLDEELARFDRVAVGNPSCLRRLRGVAKLDASTAEAWSVTGIALRAAGVARDLRRDRPVLAYGALDFQVPVGCEGDDLDRLLVVVEEVRQSLSMIDQCHKLLSSLGPGEYRVAALGEVARGESVTDFEASTGMLSFFIVSDGSGRPRRIRCRPPSFFHAQALPAMLVGERLSDLLPSVALMHLVGPEIDR
jgi:NADH-quinone oxidoreductase subunit D